MNSTFKVSHMHLIIININRLLFTEVPRLTDPTQTNASYNEGTAVDISCTAQGRPDPDVRWIYNGQEKSSGSKTAHLIFSPISKADTGKYTYRRLSMGLSVWRETSKKLTVCREKGKTLTVCRELFLFR